MASHPKILILSYSAELYSHMHKAALHGQGLWCFAYISSWGNCFITNLNIYLLKSNIGAIFRGCSLLKLLMNAKYSQEVEVIWCQLVSIHECRWQTASSKMQFGASGGIYWTQSNFSCRICYCVCTQHWWVALIWAKSTKCAKIWATKQK